MEMTWKQRVYASLPYLLVLLGAAGIAVTEEVWLAIVSLVGMWFLPSPLTTAPNVSRETSPDEYTMYEVECDDCKELPDLTDLPVPCPVLHGSAEDHVLGCEGWSFPR